MGEKMYLVKRYRKFANKMFQDKTMKKFYTLLEGANPSPLIVNISVLRNENT